MYANVKYSFLFNVCMHCMLCHIVARRAGSRADVLDLLSDKVHEGLHEAQSTLQWERVSKHVKCSPAISHEGQERSIGSSH